MTTACVLVRDDRHAVIDIPVPVLSVIIDARAILVAALFMAAVCMLIVSGFGDFRMMFVVLNRTLSNEIAMLTRMNMMRAAPENRMQQHRRNRQNGGYVTEHRGLHGRLH